MYDIFFVSENEGNNTLWNVCKSQFPNAQKIEHCVDISHVAEKSFTNLFWIIWDDVLVSSQFDLMNYRATQWDDMYVHVFRNGLHYDGICLVPKKNSISIREFNNRFFVEKKLIDILASTPVQRQMDIVFISYDEPNADANYQSLLQYYPHAKRVHGIKGIHQAHVEAAKLVASDMFYVVDADASIVKTFQFDYQVPRYEKNHVHVWRSINPVNGLQYGYGGVKLLPRHKVLNMDVHSTDMTTSISDHFKAIDAVSNITNFDTDPFSSWKSAFRECVKLASRAIARQDDNETLLRLHTWCTVGSNIDVIQGAVAGREYGTKYKKDAAALKKINDFTWLREQFDARQR